MSDKEEINLLLDRWFQLKDEISNMETKLEKCKIIVENFMNKNNTNAITNGKVTVSRKDITRTSVSKKDLPEEVFIKYAKDISYTAFHISKNKAKQLNLKPNK